MNTNKYCFDSCMFIEYSKNNIDAVRIWENLNNKNIEIVINPIIIDEVAYIMQKYGNVDIEEIQRKLFIFDILPIDKNVCLETFQCVKKYNLKMHDAFILATCIVYKIPNLVSLDKHFIKACKNENVNLIDK